MRGRRLGHGRRLDFHHRRQRLRRCPGPATADGLVRPPRCPSGGRCADEIIARLEPEQAVFAEIVRARRLHHIENPLTFLVGVLERLDVDIGHRFAVTIEDTAGNGAGGHDLHDNVGESLPGTER